MSVQNRRSADRTHSPALCPLRVRVQVDRVLADIGDEQSLSLSLSTFSGRIRRQQALLRACTSRSLVILDEVGAGTSPLEARLFLLLSFSAGGVTWRGFLVC